MTTAVPITTRARGTPEKRMSSAHSHLYWHDLHIMRTPRPMIACHISDVRKDLQVPIDATIESPAITAHTLPGVQESKSHFCVFEGRNLSRFDWRLS